jgi:formylglycine-generating enzyme required for sulfatase activity
MKRTTILVLAALTACVIAATSCKKDAELSISPQQSEVKFKADGTAEGNATFTVTTNQSSWEAVANKAWVTVSKTASGFTLTATANTALTVREAAIVTVTAGEAKPLIINVTQAGATIIAEEGMVIVTGGTTTLNGTSVTISSFQIGKHEVTQKQWYDIMGSWPGESPTSSFGLGDNYPMYNVSYDDIQLFLVKLNQQTGKNYRLPTEAEW